MIGASRTEMNDVVTRASAIRRVAVIDLGTSSIRMAIAELDEMGRSRELATVSQAAQLGKDTFTKGFLDRSTIEDCVRVLRSYRRIMEEHAIDRPDQVRAVATSAVREARNRVAFLDRIYTATGITVVPIDEAEVNRLTYFGILPQLKLNTDLFESRSVVMEVGGGSTELLVVEGTNILFSQTYRLGSLRLREPLEHYHASRSSVRPLLESQNQRIVEQIAHQLPEGRIDHAIGLGGDLRFAAKHLIPEWQPNQLSRLSVDALERLTNQILDLSDDRIVHKYHVTFHDASTLGPSLMAYVNLARACKLQEILVSNVNLRDGLLSELASRGAWTDEFSNQVVRSAVELARKFHIDEPHARQVSKLCRILFQGLREEHQLEPRFELLLTVAALLHEVGMYVATGSYHKHSQYIISNSELFGLSRSDLMLIAQTARYHRKSSPKPIHPGYRLLDRDDRIAVAKMSALLRVADALDAAHTQRFHELRFSKEGGRLIISVPQADDLSLEQLALKQSGALFEQTFGLPVLLRQLRG